MRPKAVHDVKTKQNEYKVVIMAGGTGGHVFPGIAIAEALEKEGIEVSWLGTQGGMEQEWVQKVHIPFNAISIKGLRGNGILGWLKAPFNVVRATYQAHKILKNEKPNLVLGMGGFVCGPGGVAAKLQRRILAIHEQNAIPGFTNKLLAKVADKVFVAFEQPILQGKKVEVVGNPVRSGLESLPTVKATPPFNLLVLGGSRGALALNETVPQALALMEESVRPHVVHQTGQKTLLQAQKAYQEAGVKAEVIPFIDNMVDAYREADLVICRSGALTVSELMATARPAILVPYPYAVDDHQTANALIYQKMGGGECLPQSNLTANRLKEVLENWLDEGKLRSVSQNIKNHRPQSATKKIVSRLIELMNIKAQ